MADVEAQEYVELPQTFQDYSMGFSIDGGGSVLKLIYKPSDQTQAGNGKVRLNYHHFAMDEYDELLKFIEENCASAKNKEHTAVHTGVRIQHFDDKLVSQFGSQVKVVSEFEAAGTALTTLCKSCPEEEVFYPPNTAGMEHMLKNLQEFAPMIAKMNEKDPTASITANMSDEASEKQTEVMSGLIALMQNPDPNILVNSYTKGSKVFPCLYVICGSAFTSMVFHEDRSSDMGDINAIGGRTLLGLGKVLCGAKTFDELMEMAVEGDHDKCDVLSGDLKADKPTEDMYGVMPGDVPVFYFGKLHEEKYDGSYTKSDMAASLVRALAFNVTHSAILGARAKHIQSVIMSGAFLRHQYIRDAVFKSFVAQTMWLPAAEKPVLRIIKNPGHIIATGAYIMGWEKQHGDDATSGNNDVKQ